MHRLTSLVVAVATVFGLAACGGDDSPSETTATRPSGTTPTTDSPGGAVPDEIAGVRWDFDGHYTIGGLQPLPVADSGAGLTIHADGTVAIDTGCNQGSAMATFDDEVLRVGSITVTEKACLDEDIMQIEQMLLGQLAEPQSWRAGDGELSLTALDISDTGLHFHDRARPRAADATDDTAVPPST